jgi:glycosyltransferase involved in cell wall biosynthesis/2-polyprenyl-3-methyl-5-hydroxy-6-metoxy-1,4-benzoquinol methylase
MRVTVSCAGRFHAFALVEQLYKRGHLDRFITTLVGSGLVKNRDLPSALAHDANFQRLVTTLPMPEYLGYAARYLPLKDAQPLAYFLKDNLYDQRARREIRRTDIFVGWANQSLFQLREAKTRGARTIIERGSTHIETQYGLIEEEQRRFGAGGLRRSRYDDMLVQKQLKEYHETDYIMVPSEFARRSFLERGFSDSKILKVPYGVSLDRFKTVSREKRSVPTILYAGAIGFQKGIPYLLEAAKSLRDRGLKFKLRLVGRIEVDFDEWLKQSVLRTQIDDHIGSVSQEELARELERADLFCIPSVQEGLALVVSEAMATGLPVVATRNTGAEEFIVDGEDGFLVDARSSEELANALAPLLTDHELRVDIGEKAATRAGKNSWDRYGEEIVATYERLLTTTRSTDTHHEIEGFYDEYWDRQHGWTPTHSFTQPQLDLHFKDAFKATDSVLDVGCGDASNYQAWLVKQVASLTAIDISKTGIENARRMGINGIVHDFSERFPFADSTFDGETCIEVLEHLYDPKFAVQEMYRVLKPGGLLVTSVPNNGYFRERLKALTRAEMSTSITDFENEWKGAHIRFYSMRSFTRMLQVAGFDIERVGSNQDASIFDGLDAVGGYFTQHFTTLLRAKLPRLLKLSFLEDVWPSLFAPHLIVRARKPQ